MKKSLIRHPVALVSFGAVAVLAAAGLQGCSSKGNEPFKDAPKDGRNDAPALIIEMPDGFSNLATKCINGVRYTVVFKNDHSYGSVSTIVDPKCNN